MKTAAERSIEALTWAAVVIWLGFALVAHILNYVWLVVMMLGIILLSSAIYQRSRGWHTSLSLWIFGIWMAVFSVLETVSSLVAAVTISAEGRPVVTSTRNGKSGPREDRTWRESRSIVRSSSSA